jgi:hypothetical protein
VFILFKIISHKGLLTLLLIFSFALENFITKIPKNQNRLEFTGTHGHLVYAEVVNLYGKITDIVNSYARKEIGMEINVREQ